MLFCWNRFNIDIIFAGKGQEMSDEPEAETEKTIKVSFLNSQHSDEIVEDAFLPSTGRRNLMKIARTNNLIGYLFPKQFH
jgi:hypothetical protein